MADSACDIPPMDPRIVMILSQSLCFIKLLGISWRLEMWILVWESDMTLVMLDPSFPITRPTKELKAMRRSDNSAPNVLDRSSAKTSRICLHAALVASDVPTMLTTFSES